MNHSIGSGKLFSRGLFTAAIFLALALPAPALTFNLTFDSSVTSQPNALQIETAFINATLVFQNLYTNVMTVNITVFFLGGIGLGQSFTQETGNPSYSQLTNALRNARTTAADTNAVASLPPIDPTPNFSAGTNWWVPTAESKALNDLPVPYNVATNDPAEDGQVYFDSGKSYTFDPTNRAVSGKFDFIGVAEHEISEVLGRIYSLNVGGDGYVPYDLFRFTNSGARSLDVNATNAYFSLDGGVTALKYFNSPVNGGDLQDWAQESPADSYDAFLISGQKAFLSSADLTALDILGYKLNLTVPRLSGARLANGSFQLTFTNISGLNFSILSSTNIATAATNWTVLGMPIETPAAGQYQFTDSITNKARFYRVRLN
jgi:hypothetical protein